MTMSISQSHPQAKEDANETFVYPFYMKVNKLSFVKQCLEVNEFFKRGSVISGEEVDVSFCFKHSWKVLWILPFYKSV